MPRGKLDEAPGVALYSVQSLCANESATAYLQRRPSPCAARTREGVVSLHHDAPGKCAQAHAWQVTNHKLWLEMLRQLKLRDLVAMYFVRAIGDA